MASHCNQSHSQNPWLLLWIGICFASFSESADVNSLIGELGGQVTFPCNVEKGKTINFFYVQRGDNFVNGYYSSKDIHVNAWNNTKVDRSYNTVDMYNLSIAHIGTYQCYIQYIVDNKPTPTTTIVVKLSVTARYSRPTVTISCGEENHNRCTVTCASHGGYPEAKMGLEPVGNSSRQLWSVVNSSTQSDADTKTYNSSSTVLFNCSLMDVQRFRCSVGEAISDEFTVCPPPPPPPPPNNPTAIIVAVAVCAVVILVLLWQGCCKKRHTATAEPSAIGCPEVVSLTGVTGTEAS